MTDHDDERRAYKLLQWVPYGLRAEFDDDSAKAGYYTKIQRQRSDEALNAFDAEHPSRTSDELTAFRELERLGIYSKQTLFSPSKAKDGHYTERLKKLREPGGAQRSQGPPARRSTGRRRSYL